MKTTRILQIFQEEHYKRTNNRFGDVNVNELITMYKKLQFHNHQNLKFVELSLPLEKDYDTESTWLEIPGNIVSVYRRLLLRSHYSEIVRNNHFEGIANAIKNASMMVTMAARDDIDVTVSSNALIPDDRAEAVVYLFIYDKYVGGLGYTEKIFDLIPKILENAIRMVKSCPCHDGCPACVGDYTLDKNLVLWGLHNLLHESDAPESVKLITEAQKTAVQKRLSFFTLAENWTEFCICAEKNGDSGVGEEYTSKTA